MYANKKLTSSTIITGHDSRWNMENIEIAENKIFIYNIYICFCRKKTADNILCVRVI